MLDTTVDFILERQPPFSVTVSGLFDFQQARLPGMGKLALDGVLFFRTSIISMNCTRKSGFFRLFMDIVNDPKNGLCELN